MLRQKNPWRKALTRAICIAPTLAVVSAAVLLIFFATANPSRGQTIGDTEITLTCSDGPSVALAVDSNTLLALTSEVQALSSDPTSGLTCTIDPAAMPPTSWTVYDYNPSGRAISPRVSPNSMPAMTSGETTSFPFKLGIFTALLTTRDAMMTGDLSGKTLSVGVSVDGAGSGYQDQNNGGCIPDRKSVRFYFTSPKASGTTGPGTTGFFTQFWWSNPMSVTLATNPQGIMTISQIVNEPSMWSDWNGKFGDGSNCSDTGGPGACTAGVAEAFQVAIRNVQAVGLSFGGGCFFENGVTINDGSGTFKSTFTATP